MGKAKVDIEDIEDQERHGTWLGHGLWQGMDDSLRRPLRFEVSSVHQYPKADFPREAVFGTVAGQALRPVTCGGSFDSQRHSYRDNVVVDATLTGFSKP